MTSTPPAPPPRRTYTPSTGSTTGPSTPESTGWKGKFKTNATIWGKKAMDKGVKISDNVGGRVNDIAAKKFGTEAFWPVTGDFPSEMDKAARILRAFTVDGVVTEEKSEDVPANAADDKKKKKKKYKVIRKIPPSVIAQAKGLAIFTSMRTGIAPFGGAGGAGLVVAKLPDGTWSAPASISPNNLSTGFLLGVDVYDCVLVIRSQKALDSFATHKVTLGTELAVVGGPYGVGAAVEAGIEKAPVFSYVRSRGLYAGVELVGQVFVERFDENAAMYHWPRVKAGDILAGKVRVPVEAKSLHEALQDAESGRAQREKGDALDLVVAENAAAASELDLNEGEVLKLPPTPTQTDGHEHESDPETEIVHHASHPGSHNPSYSDLRGAAQTQTQGGLLPPPLPTRRPNRPPLYEHHSSTSHYSDASDESPLPPSHDDLTIPPVSAEDDLPTYASQYTSDADAGFPDEKRGVPEAAVNDNGEPMSEAERREWDEFLQEHAAEQERARQEVSVLSDRLQEQTFQSGPQPATAVKGEEREENMQ